MMKGEKPGDCISLSARKKEIEKDTAGAESPSRCRHARHPEELSLSGRGDHAMSVPCTDEASPRYRRDGSGKCVAEM